MCSIEVVGIEVVEVMEAFQLKLWRSWRLYSNSTWRWGLALGFCVFSMWVIDPRLSRFLRGVDETIIDFFRVITVAGEAQWYLMSGPTVALVLWLIRRRVKNEATTRRLNKVIYAACLLTAAMAVLGGAGDVIKGVVGGGGAELLGQLGLYGFFSPGFLADYRSFPSGHANTFFVLALVAGHYWRSWRVVFFWGAVFFASSRVMVNAHYLSDVIGGAAVAVGTTAPTLRRVDVWMQKSKGSKDCVPGRGGS
ncbi:membrane hypothetical protein [Azospirillaceae bacterium]